MEEQLVTFKTAKLAKEKGFKEYTIEAYYDGELSLSSCYDLQEPRKHTPQNETYAPTQSLLQRWLREVKDIHIVVYIFKPEDKNKYCCDIVSDIFEENLEDDQSFDTYEEALEQALYQALELIK